jgi:flavin reductase (DIM6/NTAB) family NADH-FMN oxidoreductase RutF
MVTVSDGEQDNVLTVAWCGILSTDPARAYISVRPARHSYEMLKKSGEFVINLTTESLARTTDYVGIFTGGKVNKFEKCNLTRVPSKVVSAPTIAESPLAIECKVFEVIPSGTHDIFLADIVSVSCDENILDDAGKIRFDKAGLLAYAHGEYYALGEKVGKFGFSIDKPKKSAHKPKSTPNTNNKNGADAKGESTEENKKRPFYLDAPRGKGKGKGKRR